MMPDDRTPPDLSMFDRARIDTSELAGGFIDIGWTDDDGQGRVTSDQDRDPGEREATRTGTHPHLDALAPAVRRLAQRRIDERQASLGGLADVIADMDAATEGLCACGCGIPITAASPSAYYASAECQQAWMARHVDNPQEVYSRGDAATYPRNDDDRQTLTDPAAAPSAAARRAAANARIDALRAVLRDSMDPQPRALIYQPGSFPPPLAYRRTCPACEQFMVPLIYADRDAGVRAFDQDHRIYITEPAWTQECSACHTAIVGTVHVPVLHRTDTPPGWTLELHTTYGRVRSTITDLAIARLAGTLAAYEAFTARTWVDMERDLARFEREWRGRLTGRIEMTGSFPVVSPDRLRLYFNNVIP